MTPPRSVQVRCLLVLLSVSALALTACSTASRGNARETVPAPLTPTEREIAGTVDRLFAAMRLRDTVTLRALISPDLVIVSSIEPAASGTPSVVRRQTSHEFLATVAGAAPDELRERIWKPQINVDGAVATLWAPYDFHLGAKFSHCGIDSFQFVRQGDAWTLSGLSYTVRLTGCVAPSV